MNAISQRIAHYLELKNGGNQSELARYCSVSPQAVQKWIAGVAEPRGKNLDLIAQFLGVSAVVLRFGDEVASLVSNVQPVSIADADDPDLVEVRKIKLRLSAGISGFSADQEIDDGQPLSFRRSWFEKNGYIPSKLIAIKVKGESMEPSLYDGDTVVINTADRRPADGEVFAVNYEGEAVVKRMVRDLGQWYLASDNADRKYGRKVCQGDACIVIGKVVQKQSERI